MTIVSTGKIELSNVTKSFGDLEALHAINLDIAAGEYCCLLGPSGCGKTTLLRLIAGHDVPTTGDISIDDKSVLGRSTVERGTAMMFQNYALFPHLSVLDNVAFALKMRGVSRDDRHTRARELVEKVGLEALATRLPEQLSGGQQQRVALARALITDPQVLLLDEPLSALDEFLRLKMRGELRKIQQDLGITFIHVTHSQLEAIGVADKVVVMDNGRIEQVGTPSQIYTKPRNSHVALFIGGQNVIQGTASKIKNGRVSIVSPDGKSTVTTSLPEQRNISTGNAISVAVRRDKITINSEGSSKNIRPKKLFENKVLGKILAIEYQGSYVKLTIETNYNGEFIANISDEVFVNSKFQVDDAVIASFSSQAVILLESNENIAA